ncbi:MAG: hypothetical protein J6P16_05110 [Eubacterium sp.]|nr:hypothetical protein [Eubacterium sp.]
MDSGKKERILGLKNKRKAIARRMNDLCVRHRRMRPVIRAASVAVIAFFSAVIAVYGRVAISRETRRFAALVVSVIMIFVSVTGIIYPSIREEDYVTRSLAEGEAVSGAALMESEMVYSDEGGGAVGDGQTVAEPAFEEVTGSEAENPTENTSSGEETVGQTADVSSGVESDVQTENTSSGVEADDQTQAGAVVEENTSDTYPYTGNTPVNDSGDGNTVSALETVDNTSTNDNSLTDGETADPEEEKEPEPFYASKVIDDVEIFVSADAGVLPAGATLDVRTLLPEEREQVQESVEYSFNKPTEIIDSYAYDIKIYNAEGIEVQPDTKKGNIRVAFASDKIAESDHDVDIYHVKKMDEEIEIPSVQDLKVEKLSTHIGLVEQQDAAFADTTGFSYYILTLSETSSFTNTYTIQSEGEYRLVDIAKAMGCSDAVDAVIHNLSRTTNNSAYLEIFYDAESYCCLRVKQTFSDEKHFCLYWDTQRHSQQTMWTSSHHLDVHVKCDEVEEYVPQDGEILLWIVDEPNTTVENDIYNMLVEIGGANTVKKYKNTELTSDVISGVKLIYLVNIRSKSIGDNTSVLVTENNVNLLKNFVAMGGRIVMQGENPNYSGGGNTAMSVLASRIGGNFTITDKGDAMGVGTLAEVNPEAELGKYVEEVGGIESWYVSHIDTSGNAIWVCRTCYQNKYFNFIVDQQAGRGRITAISDINFINKNTNGPHHDANVQLFKNLFLDAVENIKRVMANPKVGTDYVVINPSASDVYYRIRNNDNESTELVSPSSLKIYDDNGNENTSAELWTDSGWTHGNGENITISGLTHDTKYILEAVHEEYVNNNTVTSDKITEVPFITLVDPRDPRIENGDNKIVSIHRYSNEDPSTDTIEVTDIMPEHAGAGGFMFALKAEAGNMLTDFMASDDEGKLIFTDVPEGGGYYLVAIDPNKDNKKSATYPIPCCLMMNEWRYDGQQKTVDPLYDFAVKTEGNYLAKDTDYTIESGSVLSAVEIGDYNFTMKFGGIYNDTMKITKTWTIHKSTFPDVLKSVYISKNGSNSKRLDLSSFVASGGTMGTTVDITEEDALSSYITEARLEGTTLIYTIAPHDVGIDGRVTIDVAGGERFDDYTLTVNFTTVDIDIPDETPAPTAQPYRPATGGGSGGSTSSTQYIYVYVTPSPAPTAAPLPDPKNVNTHVMMNGKDIQNASVRGLEEYALSQPGKTVDVTLSVTQRTVDDLDDGIRKNFRKMRKQIYEEEKEKNIDSSYFDILVTKRVDGGEPEVVSDLGSAIEIEISGGRWLDEEPVAIRNHGGNVIEMKELMRRPSGDFEDGTFYVNGDGTICLYARYFSEYSLSYLRDVDGIAGKPVKTKPGVELSDDGGDTVSAPAGSGRISSISPETGDRMPLLWVWIMMLTSGIVLFAYAMGFIRKKSRG